MSCPAALAVSPWLLAASYSLPKRRASAGAEGLGTGLVPSTTSGTCPSAVVRIEVDTFATRAKRMRKSIITGARLHEQEAKAEGFRGRWAMLTCTYAPESRPGPRDISGLLRHVRGYFGRVSRSRYGLGGPRFRYVWTGELTKRNRPHYHVLFWLPKGIKLPKPDERGWWSLGSTRIEWARNAVGYIAKYASKFCGVQAAFFPKGFRTHAVGGLNDESKRELRWWRSPLEAREHLGPSADIRKIVGGYFDKITGAFWPSPWKVIVNPDGQVIAWKTL